MPPFRSRGMRSPRRGMRRRETFPRTTQARPAPRHVLDERLSGAGMPSPGTPSVRPATHALTGQLRQPRRDRPACGGGQRPIPGVAASRTPMRRAGPRVLRPLPSVGSGPLLLGRWDVVIENVSGFQSFVPCVLISTGQIQPVTGQDIPAPHPRIARHSATGTRPWAAWISP